MAYYNGKVKRNMLVDKIVELMTTAPVGSSEPYWKKVNSGNFSGDGYILKSNGKNGSDDIYIRFSNTTLAYAIVVSVLEGYTPNNTLGIDGVITGESGKATVPFHTSASYDGSFPVEYFLSFDRNKMILVLRAEKSFDGTTSPSLLWAGMPERMDAVGDKTNGAVSIACSKLGSALIGAGSWGPYSICKTLSNRKQEKNVYTSMVTMGTKYGRSKGWGDDVMLPAIYLEDYSGQEGIRSIMDGVHPIYQDPLLPDFKDGDEVTKDSKRFLIFQVAYDGNTQAVQYSNCFPSGWMAMEKLL